MRLAFTPEAVGDLRRLREFIAIHDPAAAQRVANHLLTAIDRLESFPELGVPVAMAPDPQVIRKSFRVRSRIVASTLTCAG